MYRWFLALRYLLQRPINLLGMFGVMLSVWALLVVVSIFSGYIVEVREHIRATTADVSVFGLPVDCSFERMRKVIEADPNVLSSAPRMAWVGLLHPAAPGTAPPAMTANSAIGEDSRFVHLVGIDPDAELAVSGLAGWLAAVEDPALRIATGDLLQPTGGVPSLLLSERRLALEGLRPGHSVRVTCARMHQGAGQNLEADDLDLAVQGAFASKYVLFDASTSFVHIDTLRKLLAAETADACNVVAVKLRDPSTDAATAQRLTRALEHELGHPVYVQNWEQTNATFLSAVDHQRALMKLVLFVIMVVAAFLMFATLSMMVTEKINDIGILTAMGANRRGVLQVFLTCGMAIAAVGTVLGILFGCLSAIYLDDFNNWMRASFDVDLFPTTIYNLKRVPHDLDPVWIGQVALMAMGVSMVVSGLPAWRAARHDPIASLRED